MSKSIPNQPEIMALKAQLFELRKLLNERPAINAGLFEAYSEWTAKVYMLDWLDALDAVPYQDDLENGELKE